VVVGFDFGGFAATTQAAIQSAVGAKIALKALLAGQAAQIACNRAGTSGSG
jgi:hypothetical protein